MAETRRSLWRHPDFLKLWTGETISQVGTQVTQLALPLVAIVVLVATPFEVALLGTVEFLPFILLGLPAGVWVDRLRRRPILIAGDLGRAFLLASIPLAYVAGVLTIWQLFAVAFLVGSLTVFFDVSYQSYLPSLVDREDLVEGNAKLEISRSGAALVGPSLGGILVEWLTAPVAILVDAVSYLGSALFIFLIRRPEPEPVHPDVAAGGERPSMRRDIAQGLRYVGGQRQLRLIAASTGISNFFNQFVFALLLVYAVRDLGMSAGVIGVVFAIGNIGWLAAAVTATRIQQWIGLGPAIVLGGAAATAAVFFVPLATPATAVPFLIVSGLIAGFGNVVYNVNQVSFRQAITPERMQGRMNATMRFIVWGTIPIGSILAGVLGTVIGILPTIWIGVLGGALGMIPLLLAPVRGLRALPASPEAWAEAEAARVAGGIGPIVPGEASVEIEERMEIAERDGADAGAERRDATAVPRPAHDPVSDAAGRGDGSLFRHPDFVKFWTAQTVSQFGSQVSLLAIPLVAISFLDSSPAEVALLSTMEFLPFVFFTLPVGVWLDRLRRRPIMIAADVARALLLATIPRRVGRRRADDLAALRRRVRHGDLHRLLRRGVPGVPAVARRARADPGRQRQARDDAVDRPDGGARDRRVAHRRPDGAGRGDHELALVHRLRHRARRDPPAGAGARARSAAGRVGRG